MNSLFYYHKPSVMPFRNVVELGDDEIVEFMRLNLSEDAIFHAHPRRYIQQRRETEAWLYETFCALGGKPVSRFPIYMTLGSSSYIESLGLYSVRREFPLSLFPAASLSFTFPDSYVSRRLSQTGGKRFNPKFHGKVFLLDEILSLMQENDGLHNEAWKSPGQESDIFIEVQIWDPRPLLEQ